MQELAYVVLGEQAGALVVISRTGAVLTLASTLAMILTSLSAASVPAAGRR